MLAPPPLSKQAHLILSDILDQTSEIDANAGVDRIYYRARYPDSRPLLDELQNERFLHDDNGKYRVTLMGLFILRNSKAIEILSIGQRIFFAMKKLYKEDAKKAIGVVNLASSLESPAQDIIKALVYLRDASIWGGYSTNLSESNATIQAGENILDYVDFDSVLARLWEWHKSSYPKDHPFIFGRSEEENSTDVQLSNSKKQGGQGSVSISPSGFSDAPITIEHDSLGYRAYAEAIVDFLTHKNTSAPFSLAITGPWGSGKTTLLRWVQKALEQRPDPYQTVWFSPWKHSQQEEVWASFAREVIKALITSPWAKFQLRLKRFADSLPSRRTIFTTIAVAVLLLITAITIGAYVNLHIVSYLLATLAVLSLIFPYVSPLWKALKSPLLKLLASTKGPDYDRILGFQKEFEEDLTRLMSIATSPMKPLFIFVDDLDRAPPPVPVKLLEAMNILIGQERCIFVVGLDLAIVGASIEAEYLPVIKQLESSVGKFSGKDFIEKLVQLEFALPALTDYQLDAFLDSMLQPTKVKAVSPVIQMGSQQATTVGESAINHGAHQVIQSSTGDAVIFEEESDQFIDSIYHYAKCLPRNPRKIKRFINSYRLLAYIAARRGLFAAQKIDLEGLGAVVVLAIEYPEIYRLLSQNDFPTKFQQILKWISEDAWGGKIEDKTIWNYGLSGGKEKYRSLQGLLNVLLIDCAANISDYLSLSAVIEPGAATN
jgi:hypothetical protein